MNGRVLVTGASGFVGRDLVRRLAASGWHVRAAARDPMSSEVPSDVERALLPDLAGQVDWSRLVDGMTHVVHLAAIAHSTLALPEATYHAVNAEAVRSLALAARTARVRRVVSMSSVRAQTGPATDGVVTEDRVAAPVDAYGRAKLAGERFLADAFADGDTDWCTLRPVVVYGPGVKANMAALARLARTPWPLPIGGLPAKRSVLGLANLAGAVEHALASPGASRRTFLLADPGPLTIPQIVAAMREGQDRPRRIIALPLAPVRLAATLAGQRAAWKRIAGDLVVSTGSLEDSGWSPVETAHAGLMRWMREAG